MDNDTKHKIMLAVILILIAVLLSIINKLFINKKINLEEAFKESAKLYYEDDFYEHNKNIIESYNNIGFKLDFEDVVEKGNRKLFKSCNMNNSYIIIYPISPFRSTDYEMKVVLDCE